MHTTFTRSCAAVLVLFLSLFAGCSCSSTPAVSGVTKNDNPAPAPLQDLANVLQGAATAMGTGNVEMNVEGEVKADRCFARFTPPANGRSGVLQLMTNEKLNPDIRDEHFPAVLLWAEVQAASLAELNGQTITGHLFVQRDVNSLLYASPPSKPVAIKVASASALAVTCEVRDAELPQADGDKLAKANGKLVAVVK
ncbi:MAG: hypothetical protein SFU86_24270 [Pirellulaceae bacterium]|nr:hypothetical protein [Pirellulaceae bacterium]